MWLFSVWFHYFLVTFNKPNLISVPKIEEITYTIYQGLSKIRLYKEYVGRKVNNVSGFNLRRKFAFACFPSLSLRVITWFAWARDIIEKLLPGQWTTSKKHATSRLEPAIWSCDTGYWIPCFDSCQLIITWMSKKTLLFSRYGTWRANVRTYVRTITWQPKFLRSIGYEIFLKYGAPQPLSQARRSQSHVWESR